MRMCFHLRDGLLGLSDLLLNVLCVFLLKSALPFLLWVLVTVTRGFAAALFLAIWTVISLGTLMVRPLAVGFES